MVNNEIRIRFVGKKDCNDKDYYVARTRIPATVNLADTALLFFPDEDEEGKFGGDLVIKIPTARKTEEKSAEQCDRPRRLTRSSK